MNRTIVTSDSEPPGVPLPGKRRRKVGVGLSIAMGAVVVALVTAIGAAASVNDQGPSPAENLLLAQRPEVAEAMQGVAEKLMTDCLGQGEASELISTTLRTLGVSDFSVRTDGPLAYPSGQGEAVRSHIAAGCFVYSGAGQGGDGGLVQYISGP